MFCSANSVDIWSSEVEEQNKLAWKHLNQSSRLKKHYTVSEILFPQTTVTSDEVTQVVEVEEEEEYGPSFYAALFKQPEANIDALKAFAKELIEEISFSVLKKKEQDEQNSLKLQKEASSYKNVTNKTAVSFVNEVCSQRVATVARSKQNAVDKISSSFSQRIIQSSIEATVAKAQTGKTNDRRQMQMWESIGRGGRMAVPVVFVGSIAVAAILILRSK